MTAKIVLKLQNEDKRVRKSGFIELRAFLEESNLSNEEIRNVFVETQMYTLNGLRDKAETVREEAIKFMNFFIIEKLPLNDFYLTYVFPVLVERIGNVELIEESEEIRLQLVTFLNRIIEKYENSEQLKPFLGDCILILCETVKDKHPSIKELSCKCVVDLAHALPRDFHLQAENLIKPTITCFTHQRYKVRVAAICAIGEIVMHSSYKGLDESVGPLAQKLFDQMPIVRRTVAQVAARWLLEYRDRYSFFHKILPLILTGLNDEVEETRLISHQLWERVGLQYQNENEKDLKDQIDFLLELPKYYPKNLNRPNLGCRVLVQRNVIKLAKALSSELLSWQEDVRFRCSQLLCSLVLHAEEGIVQNLQDLLPAMYSAARDQDRRVVDNISKTSEYLGVFVPSETWTKLILPAVQNGCHFGHLVVLSSLIRGSPDEYITGKLREISELLADDEICYTRKNTTQSELVGCVKAILAKLTTAQFASEIGFNLFKILVAVNSLKTSDSCFDLSLLTTLSEHLKLPSHDDLWLTYTTKLLEHIRKDPKSWTVMSPERCIFETLLLEGGASFTENLRLIGDVLVESLDVEGDVEARLRTFWALSTAFEKQESGFRRSRESGEFFDRLISEIFVPSLVWRPGLTAEALRTMAAACLLSALTALDGDVSREISQQLVPLLVSLMEDASAKSRQLAVECVALTTGNWTNEDLVKVYPEILKRLDDPTDKVRECALKVLPTIFSKVPPAFKEAHFKAHHELIIDTLLTHFDDDNETIRELVFEVLKVVAAINREELTRKVEKHKPLLCNQQGCNEVLKLLDKMTVD